MSGIRNRIERWFEALSDLIYDNRYKTILLMILFVGLLGSQIPKTTIDTSTEGFLHETDPSLLEYEKFRDQFGREQMLIIALNPPDVFDPVFLEKLKTLHEDLKKNAPYLEEVTNLINARNTRGHKDELIVKNLFEFGMLTGITIIMALLSDYFIAPSLMAIVNRTKKQP